MALELKINTDQKIHVKVNPVTSKGNPAQLDGPIKAEIGAGDGSVSVDEDGRGFTFTSGTEVNDNLIKVSADADLGEGIKPIEAEVVIHVVAPEANDFGFVADQPENK